jgi:dephospho-CoA kinase
MGHTFNIIATLIISFMIIGITGTIGAGKGTAVEYLVHQKGYRHISARAVWTLELEKQNLPVNRDTMTALANELRAEHGADYFVRRALEEVDGNENVVIESIRTIAELELLQQEGAVTMAIDADQKIRYSRIHGRGSALDDVTFEQFVQQEKNEMKNTDPNKQNIAAVMKRADFRIQNTDTVAELHAQIEEILIGLEI